MNHKNCQVCKVVFYQPYTCSLKEWNHRKFCSIKCKAVYQTGRPGAALGIPKSIPENRHHKWKGDLVGYVSLHQWVAKWKGKPQMCEFCGSTDRKRYHWANVSGDYLRELDDYIRLCPSCHKNFDKQKGYGSKDRYIMRVT